MNSAGLASPDSNLPSTPREPQEGLPAWLAFFAVGFGEYFILSSVFDAHEVLAPAGLDHSLSSVGSLLPLAFIVAIAMVVAGGHRASRALAVLEARTSSRASVAFGLHVVAALTLFSLIHQLVGGQHDQLMSRLIFSIAAIAGVLAGGTLALGFWSRGTLARAYEQLRPVLVIGFSVGALAWGAGWAARVMENPLAGLTLELVHALLTVIADDPVASIAEKLVGTQRFFVTVAPTCSGVEGLGLMSVFVSAFLVVQRRELRWPRAFALLPLSLIAIWLLNVVRITTLIAVGTWGARDVALGGFHSKAGWVFFTLCAWAVVAFAERSSALRAVPTSGAAPLREAVTPGAQRAVDATIAYLLPLLGVLAVTILSGLVSVDFDWLYPVRVVIAAALLWRFRGLYRWSTLGFSWWSVATGLLLTVIWILGFEHPNALGRSLGEQLAELPTWVAAAWLSFRVVGTVVTVPIVEELAFRGLLMRRLCQAEFDDLDYSDVTWLSLVMSSLAFGLLHSQLLLGVCAGLVFGALARFRNSLSEATVAHAITNLGLVIYVFATGEWGLL